MESKKIWQTSKYNKKKQTHRYRNKPVVMGGAEQDRGRRLRGTTMITLYSTGNVAKI